MKPVFVSPAISPVDQAKDIAEREMAQSETVYLIQEDLEAYYNRVLSFLREWRPLRLRRRLPRLTSLFRDLAAAARLGSSTLSS